MASRWETALWWTCLGLLCAALTAPLLLVDVPPLLDYPNHLARAVLLANDGRDPFLASIAELHWLITPNLALDAILPPLIRVLPVHVAGRIVIALFVLLPVLGAIAYSRAVFGKRCWWSLAVGLVAYNATMLMGFMNFEASLGAALLVAAIWVRWRDVAPRRTVAAVAIGMVLVFFCHLMGLLFAVGLIAAYELERMWRTRSLWHRLPACLAILAVPAWLYTISSLGATQGDAEWVSLPEKLRRLQVAFANYDLTLDLLTTVLAIGFATLCILTRRAQVPMRAGLALAGLVLVYAFAPNTYKGTNSLDLRMVVMLGLLLFATIRPTLPRRLAITAGLVFASLFVVRMAVLADVWHGHARDLAELRTVIADIPAGSRVYMSAVTPDEAPAYWRHVPRNRMLSNGTQTDGHVAALLLIERHAFWPLLFDEPAQQPITLRLAFRDLAEQTGGIRGHHLLAGSGQMGTCGYDYVLLMDAGGEPDLAHFARTRLKLLRTTDFAALYRIRTPNPDCLPQIALVPMPVLIP